MRTAALVLLAAAAAAAPPGRDPAKIPLAARVVSVPAGTLGAAAAGLTKQAGVPVAVPAGYAGKAAAAQRDVPFWDALDRLAAAAGLRVALTDEGRAVELVPAAAADVRSVAGPFRVAARQVVGRALLAENLTVHEVHLDLHWEPRYPVFRVETNPHVTAAADDRGVALRPHPAGVRTQPSGALHRAAVKLDGVTRDARRVGVLKGYFRATASEKLLAFRFDLPAAKGLSHVNEKVRAVLTGWQKDGDTWIADLDVAYPPELPEFESFEAAALAGANRVRLVGPGGKAFAPDDKAAGVAGRRVSATYYFKEDAAKGPANVGRGWALELDAASTPVEFRVPFELTDIPLP
jgi:hypothetical protein